MATARASSPTYTPEDLLAMPDGVGYELVDGHLVERNVGAVSSLVSAKLCQHLGNFNDERAIGWVFGIDSGYRCFPDAPNKVRKPDASFIRLERLPAEALPEGFLTIPPDLAAEVVSPNDLAYEIDRKVFEYLKAGVRLVWVINPALRSARIYRADGSISGLTEDDELDGEDVLPGFRRLLRDIFPPLPPPTAESPLSGSNR